MSETSIQPGRIIGGKYRVVRHLGGGGMGEVVYAVHVALDQPVAIKVLRPEIVNDPRSIIRFLREARAAARIQSDHVVRVTDVGSDDHDEAPYMVLEYLDGEDLGAYLGARGRLPIHQAVDFVLQACEGVAAAHRAGVVHRDLKPSNLFLARRADGAKAIKVVDFGISKVSPIGRPEASITTTSLVGTPVYMPPEQLRGEAEPRSDVWGLATTLFELVTGQAPFEGRTIAEICARIVREDARRASELRPEMPHELDEAIARALARNVDERTPTAAAFARAIAPFASAPPSLRVVHAPAVDADRPTEPAPLPKRRVWPRRILVTAVALIVLFVGGGIVVRMIADGQRDRTVPSNGLASQAERLAGSSAR